MRPHLLLVLAALALATPAWAKPAANSHQAASPKPSPSPKVEKPPASSTLTEQQVILPADGPYAINLGNYRGRVLVRGWNKNVLYVKAVRRATHTLEAQEAAWYASAKVEIAHDAKGVLTVNTRMPGAGELPSVVAARIPHIYIDYELYVPPEVALTLHQEDGDLALLDVNGRVSAFTRDGDVAMSRITGWAEGSNERGNLGFTDIAGDAVGSSLRGSLAFKAITGDVKAQSASGGIRIDLPVHNACEVAYQTVSGKFRSDLITFHSEVRPGERGYHGILRGPLATMARPPVRYTIDTESGDAIVAAERHPLP